MMRISTTSNLLLAKTVLLSLSVAHGNNMTLSQFQSILRTEVNNEPGNYSEFWDNTVSDEWSIASARETKHGKRRSKNGRMEGSSGFVVCDTEYNRTGEDSTLIVQEIVGVKLTPLYNKVDMTCFTVVVPASVVYVLPVSLVVAPLTPEMKMGEDLISHISSSSPMVSRIEVVLCADETDEMLEILSNQMLQSLIQDGRRERNLMVDSFLKSRTRSERRNYWHRALNETNDADCDQLISNLVIDAVGDTMSLTVASDQLIDDYRDCIHTVVAKIALQPEACFVWAYQNTEPLNTVASGVVQSGDASIKPFYDNGLDGTGQVIGLSDTGLDTDNCYFWDSKSRVAKQKSDKFDLDVRKVVQYYAGSDTTDLSNGHGTHVAGTLAGQKAANGSAEQNGTGDGVAKGAQIAFYDIGDSSGRLSTPLPDNLFAAGFKAGARIHSASWGVPLQNFYSGYDRALDAFMYEHSDFLFVSAVGNSGGGNRKNSVGSPAICKNGISVGASQNASPHNRSFQKGIDYLAEFSSRGPTRDGRRKPDVVAPGHQVLSASANPGQQGDCETSFKAGTSMATPVVAGSAAIVRQFFLEGRQSGKAVASDGFQPRASLIKAVLLNGGQALVAVQNGATGDVTMDSKPYDVHQGFGRINMSASLPIQGVNSIKGLYINGKAIKNGRTDNYALTIQNSAQCDALSATLVWTDQAGAPNCNKGCVLNDLDLYIVEGNQNSRLFPNGLGGPDSINNAERIQIEKPTSGATYTVHVKATNLMRDQEYSLAVTGCFKLANEDDKDGKDNGDDMEDSRKTECSNKFGFFNIGNGLLRGCGWLVRNYQEYSHLCNFVDVALECPSTCSACLVSDVSPKVNKSVQTPLEGRSRWFGNQFDVQAKRILTIRHFSVHCNTPNSLQHIRVYTHTGQLSKGGAWRAMCDATVPVNGYGELTVIPEDKCQPIILAANQWLSMYVTIVNDANMVMTSTGGKTSVNLANTDDLVIRSGVAVTYNDEAKFDGYGFNGVVYYTLPGSTKKSACKNQGGTVTLDDTVGDRTCAWLASHIERYEYTCEFVAVAAYCPVTCNLC